MNNSQERPYHAVQGITQLYPAGGRAQALRMEVQHDCSRLAALTEYLERMRERLSVCAREQWEGPLLEQDRDAWRDLQHLLRRIEASAHQLEDARRVAERLFMEMEALLQSTFPAAPHAWEEQAAGVELTPHLH